MGDTNANAKWETTAVHTSAQRTALGARHNEDTMREQSLRQAKLYKTKTSPTRTVNPLTESKAQQKCGQPYLQ